MSYRPLINSHEKNTKMNARVICMTLVCVQFTSFACIRTHIKSNTCDSVILMYSEILKLVISVSFYRNHDIFQDCLRSVVPVLCFMTMNLISIKATKYVYASTFVIIMQFKIFSTMIMSYILLGTPTTLNGLGLMVQLCLGTVGVSVVSVTQTPSKQNVFAVAGLLFETLLSGFTTSYIQLLFENDTLTMWRRNVHLSLFSSVLYFSLSLYLECSYVIDIEGVYISVLSALGGVIVAYSLLYAGAIDKTISTTFSIVLTSLIEYIVILKEVPNIHVILHSLSVIISIILYSFNK